MGFEILVIFDRPPTELFGINSILKLGILSFYLKLSSKHRYSHFL